LYGRTGWPDTTGLTILRKSRGIPVEPTHHVTTVSIDVGVT
jgi:hypothetical protein